MKDKKRNFNIRSSWNKITTSIKKVLIYMGAQYYFLFFLPVLFLLFFYYLYIYIDHDISNKKEILPLIISVTSISSAIIITYLFSKLFSERNSRIEYKKKVDELGIQINFFRILMYRLRIEDSLWLVNGKSIRYVFDNKLKWLTIEIYRGEDKNHRLSFDRLVEIEKLINGWMGQAYLAIKGFGDGDDSFLMYNDTNNRNYSLSDISRYDEYQSYVWSYLDEYSNNDSIFDANQIHNMWFERMDEYYRKITNDKLDRKTFKVQIKELMTYFHENIFKRHYYFNTVLSKKFPISYARLFINILVNVITLIISLVLFIIEISSEAILLSLLVSIFITNTIDLVVILIKAIPRELTIDERYAI